MNNQSDQDLIRLLFIALIISLFSIAFLTAKCFLLIEKEHKSLFNIHLQNTRPARGSQLNESIDWRKYNNKEIGIEIQFPDTWQGYHIATLDTKNPPSVGFSFNQVHRPFIIFQIYNFTKTQWNELANNTLHKIFTHPDGSVLACDGCCTPISDLTGGGQFDQFQVERCKEVPLILQSLKIIK